MAQMNFYVPDEIEEKVKKAAKKEGLTASAWLAALVKEHISASNQWPRDYFEKVLGGWEGDFPDIEDMPHQERDWPE